MNVCRYRSSVWDVLLSYKVLSTSTKHFEIIHNNISYFFQFIIYMLSWANIKTSKEFASQHALSYKFKNCFFHSVSNKWSFTTTLVITHSSSGDKVPNHLGVYRIVAFDIHPCNWKFSISVKWKILAHWNTNPKIWSIKRSNTEQKMFYADYGMYMSKGQSCVHL